MYQKRCGWINSSEKTRNLGKAALSVVHDASTLWLGIVRYSLLHFLSLRIRGLARVKECEDIRSTAYSPTVTIALLHCVSDDHVVDDDRCVLVKWCCIYADRWERDFPAPRNQRG